jgi:hypothetical protein
VIAPPSFLASADVPAPETLARAVRRLRALCLVLLTVFGVATVLVELESWWPALLGARLGARELVPAFKSGFRLHASIAALVSGLMLALTHAPWKPQRVLDAGLAFQVVAAFLICGLDHLFPWGDGVILRGMPPVVLWIMTFPLVPVSPARGALAAFSAAAMGPLSLAVHGPAPLGVLSYYLPCFVAAGVSTVSTRILYRASADASRARRLGSYRLVSKLAQGGMGEVWLAKHAALVRPAAVKLLRPALIDGKTVAQADAALRRFTREAQITASLHSPHTVQLYDFGRTDDGTIYYVMELLGGVDLERLVGRFGPQPAERVIHLLGQACHSLHEAHRAGLTHRDIKPANLQVSAAGGELDVLKVLDFGLAKVREGIGTRSERDIGGTPAYMAPEAIAVGGTIDARADVYALGAVAWFLLTGRLVFEARTTLEMLEAHARRAPTPPSLHTELPVPRALDELVLACLAKDPRTRPQSAAEVRRRLAAIVVEEAWTQERAERWWRAHLPGELAAREPEEARAA